MGTRLSALDLDLFEQPWRKKLLNVPLVLCGALEFGQSVESAESVDSKNPLSEALAAVGFGYFAG
jgi:hypothetical protein